MTWFEGVKIPRLYTIIYMQHVQMYQPEDVRFACVVLAQENSRRGPEVDPLSLTMKAPIPAEGEAREVHNPRLAQPAVRGLAVGAGAQRLWRLSAAPVARPHHGCRAQKWSRLTRSALPASSRWGARAIDA